MMNDLKLRFSVDQPMLDRLVKSLVALGVVEIPNDTRDGLGKLSEALAKVQTRRSELAETEARLVVHARRWAAEVKARKAEFDIKIDDMLLNDPEVRSAPNKEARMARARARAVQERISLEDARKEHAVLTSLCDVVKAARENLKNAKESISQIRSIAEMEMMSTGITGLRRT